MTFSCRPVFPTVTFLSRQFKPLLGGVRTVCHLISAITLLFPIKKRRELRADENADYRV